MGRPNRLKRNLENFKKNLKRSPSDFIIHELKTKQKTFSNEFKIPDSLNFIQIINHVIEALEEQNLISSVSKRLITLIVHSALNHFGVSRRSVEELFDQINLISWRASQCNV
jgi:hypothetical protein